MAGLSGSRRRIVLVALAAALGCAALASPGIAAKRVHWMKGYDAPGTPRKYDKVGVLKFGRKDARNVLVLNPGTSAGSAYFAPLARTIVHRMHGWQVWSVERRENLLEDQSVADKAKRREVSTQELSDYYLGWITDDSIEPHFQLIPDKKVEFAKRWGMNTEINDLHRVVKAARRHHRRVVVGGHSLGGSITTAYATWDFNGRAGAKGLAGLVFIDGGSGPKPISRSDARKSLDKLMAPDATPWLAFGGIAAPFLGLFSSGGSLLAKLDPNGLSLGQQLPVLPANLKPPIPATNEAQLGYAVDAATSPDSLIAAQVHAGHLAATGSPRGWVRAGELTPIQRYATMLSGWGLQGVDGTAWYHPMRLTLDSGAVADGNRNPAQKVLGVKAIHGDDVHVPMYAFGAALGGKRVLAATKALARQSHVPRRDLTLIDRHATYSHNDPSAAFPKNAFIAHLVPFLRKVGGPQGKKGHGRAGRRHGSRSHGRRGRRGMGHRSATAG